MKKIASTLALCGILSFGVGLLFVLYKGPVLFKKEHATVSKTYLGSALLRKSQPLDLARTCIELDMLKGAEQLLITSRYKKGVTKVGVLQKNKYSFSLYDQDKRLFDKTYEHINTNKKNESLLQNVLKDVLPGRSAVDIGVIDPTQLKELCYEISVEERQFSEESFIIEIRDYRYKHGSLILGAGVALLLGAFILRKMSKNPNINGEAG
jgi:hypothetical protein